MVGPVPRRHHYIIPYLRPTTRQPLEAWSAIRRFLVGQPPIPIRQPIPPLLQCLYSNPLPPVSFVTIASATEKFVQNNNLRFRYLDRGTEGKPPMVCIHGHTGQAHVWDQFARAFSSDFHVYAIDQRGHGGTQWAADDYDRDRYVEDSPPSSMSSPWTTWPL